MKKLILVIIVILSSFVAKAQKIDTVSFSLDNVELFTENGYTRIVMNSCMATEEIGYPELPQLELCYILPYNRQISSILILDSTKVLLSNNVVVYPKQPDYPMDDTIQHEFVQSDLNGFDYGVKKSISITSSLEDVKVADTCHVTFRSTDYFQITGPFQTDVGGELTVIMQECPDNSVIYGPITKKEEQ